MPNVTGWKLDPGQRAELLRQFPPLYPNVDADHVTLASEARPDAPLPGAADAEIVGRADDGAGVEELVVRLDDTTDRPDGSTFRITWSLGPGRQSEARQRRHHRARLDGAQPSDGGPAHPARWP